MKSIYVITSDGNINSSLFFEDISVARNKLKDMKNERANKIGVHLIIDEEDRFQFVFGWQEVAVTFSIIEIKLSQ